MSSYSLWGENIFNKETGKVIEHTVFFRGNVVSIIDSTDSHRIRVRIKGIDDHLSDNELPFSFSMLPKHINIMPKVGEVVFLFIANIDNLYIDRMYLGPIISQPQMLFKDSFVNGATSGLDTGFTDKRPAPSTIPENKGVYPKQDEIAILGRDNSDIILKSKEVLLRAGQYDLNTKIGDIPKFNFTSPAYIQIKNNIVIEKAKDGQPTKIGGVTNIVSNKINLLTHDGSPKFILNNQDDMIIGDELNKILATAHPMVYGDTLVTLLKMVISALINHVHPYHGMVGEDLSGRNDIDDLLKFDFNTLLSNNIKIN